MSFAPSGKRVHERTRAIYGETVTLTLVSRGAYSPGSGVVSETTQDVQVLGVAGDFQKADSDGRLVAIVEEFCVCSDVLNGQVPKKGDRLIRAGKTSEVIDVSTEIYGEFTAFTLHLRSV